MTVPSNNRRQLCELRAHINSLMEQGASLAGRDPVRLSFNGETLVLKHGMLVTEHAKHDLIEMLVNTEWPCEQQRNLLLETCLHHLTQALEQAETTLRHWEHEDDLRS
ncbi:putative protein OS=Stutzerimonas stutzeri OX=316 GN=CXK95_08325 PE=4 SV=1 [Stutzerimonas stutzeri]